VISSLLSTAEHSQKQEKEKPEKKNLYSIKGVGGSRGQRKVWKGKISVFATKRQTNSSQEEKLLSSYLIAALSVTWVK
jgi:hypothetical protein